MCFKHIRTYVHTYVHTYIRTYLSFLTVYDVVFLGDSSKDLLIKPLNDQKWFSQYFENSDDFSPIVVYFSGGVCLQTLPPPPASATSTITYVLCTYLPTTVTLLNCGCPPWPFLHKMKLCCLHAYVCVPCSSVLHIFYNFATCP